MPRLSLIALKKSSKSTKSTTDKWGRTDSTPCIDNTSILVPQHIMQKIPFYKRDLQSALSKTCPNEITTITNVKIPEAGEEAFIKTINFLGGTPLPAINVTGTEDIDTLMCLLDVYDVYVELQTKELEQAVLDCVSRYQYPKLETFVDFAREVYGDLGPKKRAVDSPIGKVVKLKLTALFPRLLQKGDVKRMTAMGGVLSTELLEVTIKYYSGVSNMKFEETE